jgi:hypothetical protein
MRVASCSGWAITSRRCQTGFADCVTAILMRQLPATMLRAAKERPGAASWYGVDDPPPRGSGVAPPQGEGTITERP